MGPRRWGTGAGLIRNSTRQVELWWPPGGHPCIAATLAGSFDARIAEPTRPTTSASHPFKVGGWIKQ